MLRAAYDVRFVAQVFEVDDKREHPDVSFLSFGSVLTPTVKRNDFEHFVLSFALSC